MSAIELSVRLDPAWNQSTLDAANADETDLRYRLFLGDVLLTIGRSDFSATWGWVPILDFLLGMSSMLDRIGDSKTETFDFTESGAQLQFNLVDSDLEISSNYVSATGRVPLDELRAVVRRVAEQTLVMLRDAAPALVHNPAYRSLSGELTGLEP